MGLFSFFPLRVVSLPLFFPFLPSSLSFLQSFRSGRLGLPLFVCFVALCFCCCWTNPLTFCDIRLFLSRWYRNPSWLLPPESASYRILCPPRLACVSAQFAWQPTLTAHGFLKASKFSTGLYAYIGFFVRNTPYIYLATNGQHETLIVYLGSSPRRGYRTATTSTAITATTSSSCRQSVTFTAECHSSFSVTGATTTAAATTTATATALPIQSGTGSSRGCYSSTNRYKHKFVRVKKVDNVAGTE